jgi:hypothetical protein
MYKDLFHPNTFEAMEEIHEFWHEYHDIVGYSIFQFGITNNMRYVGSVNISEYSIYSVI